MEIILYSLGAVGALLGLLGGSLALWRLIPRSLPVQRISDHEMRITELEIGFQSFAAQYELEVNRSRQKLARAKRDLARERGEDEEDDSPAATSHEPPAQPVQLVGKDELRRRAGLLETGS